MFIFSLNPPPNVKYFSSPQLSTNSTSNLKLLSTHTHHNNLSSTPGSSCCGFYPLFLLILCILLLFDPSAWLPNGKATLSISSSHEGFAAVIWNYKLCLSTAPVFSTKAFTAAAIIAECSLFEFMSTSSTPATAASLPSLESPSSSAAPGSRPSRLRRLSNLRAYTQPHLSGNASSGYRSYRNNLTRVVGLSLHSTGPSGFAVDAVPTTGPITTTTSTPASPVQSTPGHHQCPETNNPRLSTDLPIQSVSGSSVSDLHSHIQSSSASSRSTPSNDPESESPQPSNMVRQRNIAAVEVSPANKDSLQSPLSSPPTVQDNSKARLANSADTTPQNSTPVPMDSPTRPDTASPPSSDPTCKPPLPKPMIRFYAYQDPHQNSRPSLPFTTTSRILPDESSVIRVGRYSERDGVPVHNPTEPSDAPVGFKSKVVSRRHCEFSFVNGQWHIRDVGSSSGTFLNHMRLSQPNVASRLYTVRDGDILQLGIDFRGGEEMIFRCVRMRIECNRTWQQKANEFNKTTASLINNLGKGNNAADYAGCKECSICLGSVLRPYQCLFMAACAHVWHYKCIRRLIHSPEYPMFQCPNCRAYTDLSAEVDDSNEPFDDDQVDPKPSNSQNQPVQDNPDGTSNTGARNSTILQSTSSSNDNNTILSSDNDQLTTATGNINLDENNPLNAVIPATNSRAPAEHTVLSNQNSTSNSNTAPTTNGVGDAHGTGDMFPRSSNIDIPTWNHPQNQSSSALRGASATAVATASRGNNGGSEMFEDNPLTPRNDFGPLAFDGHAGRL
ncbi:FHA domain-containing protein [Paracoccidioides lutzii Pb01]|uniref:FHA domain-containing protein n=1 Tax=Paracoccidioides lutzii (strain ATCC MYA-826 / Pb01) TaxID=502779 RepID=C1GVA1_PARBA|nr:FHA domain-containing protein [Paracoccidioides lutzii Pb01]EEH40519.2 FHA domain-containing protein [Paracoccidioides lutzii Pb01]